MFPILLAELRPLFFRNRLWSDKDESFKAVFDVLTPPPGSRRIDFGSARRSDLHYPEDRLTLWGG